jgi:transcriptional regulator with XRE-family HTH domain
MLFDTLLWHMPNRTGWKEYAMGWEDEHVGYSPSVRRRRVGVRLRRLREDRALTADAAAKQFGLSGSQLTKIEKATRNVSRAALLGMLTHYEASKAETDELLDLHKSSSERGWWQQYGVQPGAYIDWEGEAVKLQNFEQALVPGILQTEEYAETVISATHPEVSPAPEVRAKVRSHRTALLDGDDCPDLWYIVHESALRTVIGSAAVMRDQIRRILALCEQQPRLTVQVMPFRHGAYAGLEGSFSVMAFEDLLPLGAVEHQLSTVWFDKPSQVNHLTVIFGRLVSEALSVADSQEFLHDLAKEYNREVEKE